jgi:ubiquinone/menaquinone biosynthesis C-methylase UbiE
LLRPFKLDATFIRKRKNNKVSEHWSRFWRQGYITSFAAELSKNYTGTLRTYWEHAIDDLASISGPLCAADLGTGNGAIARILLETASGKGIDLKVHGIDSAKTHAQPVAGFSLHQHATMEQLPLADKSVDLVVSQFGFEYSDTEKTLQDITRVMRSNGLLRLICHSDDSEIVRRSVTQIDHYRVITRNKGLFSCLARMIQAMGKVKSERDLRQLADNPNAERARLALNKETGRLMQKYPDSIVIAEALKQSQVFFKEMRLTPLVKKMTYLKRMEVEYRDAATRIQEQVSSALSAEKLRMLKSFLATLGFSNIASSSVIDGDSNEILGVEIHADYVGS